MTTLNLRVNPSEGTRNKQAEERVRTLITGPVLPKLHIKSYINKEQETTMIDVDFAPDNKPASGGSTRGIMRGAR